MVQNRVTANTFALRNGEAYTPFVSFAVLRIGLVESGFEFKLLYQYQSSGAVPVAAGFKTFLS